MSEKNVSEVTENEVSDIDTGNEKIDRWISENVKDDIEDCYEIAKLAYREIKERYNTMFTTNEMTLSFYGVVFQSIMEVLLSKRKDYAEFDINIADRFVVGYSDLGDDEDMEKAGSFVPHIFDLDSGKKTYEDYEGTSTLQACIEWSSQNLTANPEVIKEISTRAVKNLHEILNISLSSETVIIPFFVAIHESLIQYMMLKQRDLGEYETMINFIGCFNIIIRMNEEKEQSIEYAPNVSAKLETKSDNIATSKFE